VDMVNRIVPQLIKHGKVIRPGLGILVIPDTIVARWPVQGVVIRQVAPEGPVVLSGGEGKTAGVDDPHVEAAYDSQCHTEPQDAVAGRRPVSQHDC